MWLSRLQLSQVRNLHDLDLAPSPTFNIVHGPNASGKSSLFEAIHLLSCARSFRTRQLAQVLNHAAAQMTVTADVVTDNQGTVALGIAYDRDKGRPRLRAHGRPARKASELASILPLVTLHQESHRVFTEGPQYRREFLDWGLFHVEPTFLPVWQRYRRALKQRNSMLQQPSGDNPAIWDGDLADAAGVIDRLRRRYLDRLMPVFHVLGEMLEIHAPITTRYRPGWDNDKDFRELLAQSLRGDQAIGHTRIGPHRADVDFLIDGTPVQERLSRGQLKVLVYALNMAQTLSYRELTGNHPILLMDDLTAELDDRHATRLLDKIAASGLQVFISSSEPRLGEYLRGREHKLFHVEHGKLEEVLY